MRATLSSAQVQCKGCKELQTLARNDPDKRVHIVAEGGILVVIAAMTVHWRHEDVQKHGCCALWNLSINNNNNLIAIAADGCIPVLLAAMKVHLGHAVVQEHGCGTMVNLSRNNDHNKIAIAADGGIPVHPSAASNDEGAHGTCKGAEARLRRAVETLLQRQQQDSDCG